MRSVAEVSSLGDVQDTCEKASKETLPGGPYVPAEARRAWMLVEHYLALNPKATVARACAATGVAPQDYERAKKHLVGGDISFRDQDKIRPENAIVTGKKKRGTKP